MTTEEVLYGICRYLKFILDIDFKVYFVENANPNISSYTDTKNIYLSLDWVKSLSKDEEIQLISALSHEAFHIFQFKSVMNKTLPENIQKLWEYEFFNYISPDDDEENYSYQSIEMTAVVFSSEIMERLTDQTLIAKKYCRSEDFDIVDSFRFNYILNKRGVVDNN